ncbi:MAG: nucleotidyl transferase AbiEii/AbiGii toxin family protein [Candidatus Thiodiazotropha sp. (ex Ctena orbiculata)]|uniref:Nucleotidyl transferase AbiEii/AbiGii toxin family protein n=1 Tax=Candidatus Thiodiazotropha taylori TaxID=2792791 RepID=A0A944MBH0_9GAMM|nr:nucleotidyl transferase AbiEii/AbiGii toxin family protein [Candidatus Thiodiazotropha taylori]
MPVNETYRAQVDLLIRCLPAVAKNHSFALKGGTAINLFLHDMPRLSVDIDLTFLPITDRDTALTAIADGLVMIGEEIRKTIPQAQVQSTGTDAPKLQIATPQARIRVEPSPIARGSLFPPVETDLCQAAQDEYELFVRVLRLATADLYGGKLCAALDRQHPRDLFDIKQLQDAGEISDDIRQAFVVYLAGHRRPMAEMLAPNIKPIGQLYTHHFAGMTTHPVELEELEAARAQLFAWVRTALTEDERKFLLAMKQGEPDWDLMPFDHIEQLPAIQWKLHNVNRMSARSHQAALARLRDVLGL